MLRYSFRTRHFSWRFLAFKAICIATPHGMERERSEAFGVDWLKLEQKCLELYNCGVANVQLVDMGREYSLRKGPQSFILYILKDIV